MRRRDFVRAVLAVGAAPKLLLGQQAAAPPPPPAPVPWLLGLNAKTPMPQVAAAEEVAAAQLRFFSTQQMATLARLSDVLMPPVGEKPGALQARTPMFLDFLIGSSSGDRQKLYSSGLEWLNGESKKKYNTEFARLTDQQAGELLKPWMRTWLNDHPPTEEHADFVNIVHDDIRTATVNSREWSAAPEKGREPRTEEELYWSPIQPDLSPQSGRALSVQPHVQAVPPSKHRIPSYQR
ncbi:gluconate 2-dehydrogenase subunit 3 family protein [Occallatibacter savannae]|uniref:gluconate 2-dehydrogenase subunit 3 family protein n=1 Tax=Occallatibacter savannae TaxID=1002691 RepID=UPI000D69B214|nr:gluconate 2-dehydrogenase subunit 3 family protein [Occallatibacter savannae]